MSKTGLTPSADASAALEPLLAEATPSFDRLFGELPHVVLAISGGSDSMALLHLAVAWRAVRLKTAQAPNLSVVTVDHALRDGSAEEARAVAECSRSLGLPHAILRWDGPKPATGVQAAARAERYRLIRRYLDDEALPAVATAHTIDDQAETVLMRLARGSGIDGLSAMRPRSSLPGGRLLLRPLLGLRKSELTAYLEAQPVGWLEDPSNTRPEFERVRVRTALRAASSAGFSLDAKALGLSALRARRAADALAVLTEQAWRSAGEKAAFNPLGYATVDWTWLQTQPEDIRLRLLAGLVERIGGRVDAVSLGQLEAATAGCNWRRPSGLTLHGTEWTPAAGTRLHIFRECGREDLAGAEVALRPGGSVAWDRRFLVNCISGGLAATAAMLGAAGLASIEASGFARVRAPVRALWSLPAVSVEGAIVCVPNLGFAEAGFEGMFRSEALAPHFGAGDVPS